jgi:hypothetical protein
MCVLILGQNYQSRRRRERADGSTVVDDVAGGEFGVAPDEAVSGGA